ncbi:MAG TPA: hypothetical protein VGI45_32090 [Terracidiphilus sp.]|jgi:hypothetical protein
MTGKFTHRFNADGTVDSVCHCCFRTVGPVEIESALATLEEEHVCDPDDLLRFSDAQGSTGS